MYRFDPTTNSLEAKWSTSEGSNIPSEDSHERNPIQDQEEHGFTVIIPDFFTSIMAVEPLVNKNQEKVKAIANRKVAR